MNSQPSAQDLVNDLKENVISILGFATLLGDTGANVGLCIIIPSVAMRVIAAVAALIASVIAFPFVILIWKRKSKRNRLGWFFVFVSGVALACVLAWIVLWILDAENVTEVPWAERTRELLLETNSFWANTAIAVAASFGSFCLVVAATILSPKLNR